MNLDEVKNLLTLAGFTILPDRDDDPMKGKTVFGTVEAEKISVGKDHFIPHYRTVFFAEAVGGFYVTSNIVGNLRKYRGRQWNPAEFNNIFGHGKTPVEAVNNFLSNFKQKRYNVGV